jgi:serine O-acetyltransferase
MFENLRQDLRRCDDQRGQRIREVLFNPGMWAVFSYRLRRWLYVSRPPKPLRLFLNPLSSLLQLCTVIISNIELPITADIGPGLYIPHTGYIILANGVKMGANCTLTQGVTIGHRGGGSKSGRAAPVIGNRVFVGPAAAIAGPIVIGDDALVGVGAIVIESVEAGGVVVGNPARLISSRGSFDLITYTGMETDAERTGALARLRGEGQPVHNASSVP